MNPAGASSDQERSEPFVDRYLRLIENADVGLYQTGLEGDIRWVNDAAARIVGYESPEEFIGSVSNIRDIYVDPSRRDEFRREAKRAGVKDFEYEIRRRDGSSRWITVSATPIRAEDGTVEGFEGSVIDVTETKLLRAAAEAISSQLEPVESVRRFAEVLRKVILFHQLTLAAIEGDRYRRLVSVAPTGEQQTLPPGEWVPLAGNAIVEAVRSREPVVVHDTSARVWGFDERLADVGVGSYAIFPLIDDDEVFATFNVGMAAKDGFDERSLDLLQKHTSSAAQAVKNILLFERQRETAERLADLDRVKNEFFAEVAHDLRHPLTAILGAALILEEDQVTRDEERKSMISMIRRNAEALAELLSRDLDVALIESGELTYDIEPLDIGTLIGEVADSVRGAFESRPIEVEIETGLPLVLADASRQVQVLQNLLSNAHKFSPPGRPIRVCAISEDAAVRVSVIDQGHGITDEEKQRVFMRLSRLEGEAPGTGLGLYIARSMVEAQGGRIWVESEPGQGATFSYTIPTTG